jgi:hypothetical protein
MAMAEVSEVRNLTTIGKALAQFMRTAQEKYSVSGCSSHFLATPGERFL